MWDDELPDEENEQQEQQQALVPFCKSRILSLLPLLVSQSQHLFF
jgi:hypothetical protein